MGLVCFPFLYLSFCLSCLSVCLSVYRFSLHLETEFLNIYVSITYFYTRFSLSVCLSLFYFSGDRFPQYLYVDYLFLHLGFSFCLSGLSLPVCLTLAFLSLRRPISSICGWASWKTLIANLQYIILWMRRQATIY